ncbi:MAG: 3-deoxy-8-phosphooctulonate synthase [Candidatus Omnitrophota bacterium]|nr:3-deoxy-8-phosphooctulonate synthase [Candidatus Omnitrophota bacterium]
MTREIKVGNVKIGGNNPLVLIAGPCVIEDEEKALSHAGMLKDITARLDIPLIYKSSYDKANRTSISSFRGPGVKKGIKILEKVKNEIGVPVLSDLHCREEIKEVKEILDVIQIPAFLCRQTDLITACSRAGNVINVKKGQFMAPWDMAHVVRKIIASGGKQILITERGTSFGYNNLVSDMRSLEVMKNFGWPIIYDATHSVQLPGGEGNSSGGQRELVPGLARAAVGMGCDGLFIEVHVSPDKAPCDGPNMLEMDKLEVLLKQVKKIDKIVKSAKQQLNLQP